MQHILVLGCGNLTGALLLAQKRVNVNQNVKYSLLSRTQSKTAELAKALSPLKVSVVTNYPKAVPFDAIILGVKPTQLKQILIDYPDIKSYAGEIISNLGGVTLETLKRCFPQAKIITRLMPSIVAAEKISHAIYISNSDKSLLPAWFSLIGTLVPLKTDQEMDDLTLLFGSNAAYMAAFLKPWLSLYPQQDILIDQMIAGLAFLRGKSIDDVINKVQTPQGITAEALKVLQEKHWSEILLQAIKASSQRATDWGKNVSHDLK